MVAEPMPPGADQEQRNWDGIIHSLPVAACVFDSAGGMTSCNVRAVALFGRQPGDGAPVFRTPEGEPVPPSMLIEGLADDQLDRPSASNPDRTVRYAILHGLHDEACHSGEVYLLFKMRSRLPS